VRGGVAEDVNARLREPFQIWIAPADLPYVQSIRDAFGLTAIDDLGKPLPDRLMSPESSTRTVHDLSPWAALSIKFAGLLTALGGAVTGVDPPRQLLAAVADRWCTRSDLHPVRLSRPRGVASTGACLPSSNDRIGLRRVSWPCHVCSRSESCRDLRDGTRTVCGLSQAHTHCWATTECCWRGRSFPGMEPDGGPRR
jgi:hypothetical protein